MLHLASTTAPQWSERVLARIDELLLDHAHCEKKAASTALSLIFRYPERAALITPLSELAREELVHFEQVVALLRARGREFERLTPSPYAAKLMQAVRTHEPARLLDTLLCCALIEARSCERMQVLARAFESRVDEPGMRELYQLYEGLLASEARHFATYVELARRCRLASEDAIQQRLGELAEHEAAVLADATGAARMHD
ncbi:tRNA-(ms[2]io[6]A)-hydroxylase [Nannocystaceae bacterium ST9]